MARALRKERPKNALPLTVLSFITLLSCARQRAGSGWELNPLAISIESSFPNTEAAKPATDRISSPTRRGFRSALRLAEDNSISPRRVVNELTCDLGHIPALHLTTVRSVEDPLTWRARVAAEHNVYAACPAHRRRPGW